MKEASKKLRVACTVFLALESVHAMINYCRNNTFDRPTNTENLHFSKENSDYEYGIYDKFKCLHCCSHGHKSIEWFKDEQPYPWPTDVSTLIIYPESGNQTIYSQQLTSVDSGKYWCIVRNDTHFLRHEVLLMVSDPSISMGWPKSTYEPRDRSADVGEFVRFYCEAFVGTIDLPDFRSEITWERYHSNRSFVNGIRIRQENIFRYKDTKELLVQSVAYWLYALAGGIRGCGHYITFFRVCALMDEKRVIGSYLSFTPVRAEDYGRYACKVKNLGDQTITLSAWLKRKDEGTAGEIPTYSSRRVPFVIPEFYVILLLLVLTAVTLTITLLHFGPYFRVMTARIFHRPVSRDDGKKDLLVIYHQSDAGEILNNLLATLKNRHRYSCSLHPLINKSQIGNDDLKAKAHSYRGLLVLMTPALVGGDWSSRNIHDALQSLLKAHFTVICFFQQALPPADTQPTERRLLQDMLSKIRYVEGTEGNDFKISNWMKTKPQRQKINCASVDSLEELL